MCLSCQKFEIQWCNYSLVSFEKGTNFPILTLERGCVSLATYNEETFHHFLKASKKRATMGSVTHEIWEARKAD